MQRHKQIYQQQHQLQQQSEDCIDHSSTASSSSIQDPTAFTALTRVHKGPVTSCAFSPDTNQILTGSEDNTILLWDLPVNVQSLHDDTINDEHKLICFRMSDHKAPVTSVSMHKRIFLSSSRDGQVKLWKLYQNTNYLPNQSLDSQHSNFLASQFKRPDQNPVTYNCHSKNVRSITISSDAKCFATGSDKFVRIWSTECKNKTLGSFPDGHTNWIKCVKWSKTNEFLMASCGDDGKICIWDTRSKHRQPPCKSITATKRMQFNCLDWHPVFEHHIATGAQDSTCAVWDLRNGKQVQVYTEHTGSIKSVAFNPGGSLLLTGSSDHTSKIFDVCEGTNMFTLISHEGPITSVCFDSTGEMFATASVDKSVTIWKRNFETVDIILDDGSEEDISTILGDYSDDIGVAGQSSSYQPIDTTDTYHQSY